VERARHTTLADTSADASVSDGATPRRAPAETDTLESAGRTWAVRRALNLMLSREIISLYLRSLRIRHISKRAVGAKRGDRTKARRAPAKAELKSAASASAVRGSRGLRGAGAGTGARPGVS
jgi:hypothetical protein